MQARLPVDFRVAGMAGRPSKQTKPRGAATQSAVAARVAPRATVTWRAAPIAMIFLLGFPCGESPVSDVNRPEFHGASRTRTPVRARA